MQSSSPTTKHYDIRTSPINPNFWYAVARADEVKDKPLAITLWNRDIVLYRDEARIVRALEDRCPHRQVRLSDGQAIGNGIECAYHGWHFDWQGNCTFVPYLAPNQKLPKCKIDFYPVRELDGFIWLFPGEREVANSILPMGLPEWNSLNYIATVALVECPGHYSYLIENLMDMYHGHLHDNYQAWASAALQDLRSDDARVDALYEAQSYYRIDKIWSILQLFIPALRRLHPEPLNVSYVYPHWQSTLGQDFKIYCLFCPVSATHTRAYLIHFTSLNAFWRLQKLPIWFRRFVRDSLFGSAQKLLDGLVLQDVKMIAQEQQAYLKHPELKNYELNPTIASVQRLIRHQAELGEVKN